MGSRLAYYFAAFAIILTYSSIRQVKGESSLQIGENGDPYMTIIKELQQLCAKTIRQQQNEEVQSIHKLLNASFQQMKNLNESLQQIKSQQETIATSLQEFDRRSQEQAQSIHALLNASFQEMKSQQYSVMRSVEVFGRRLQEQDISIKNQTQNSSKLEIAVGIDLVEVPILLSTANDWIVLMHRFDGSLNFNRSWIEYRNGFGEIGRGEFWLGNEKIHRLTKRFNYTLRIEVQLNETGRWYFADYATFSLDSANNKYALHLSGYSGNAGDSLTNTSVDPNWNLGGMSFTTRDADNDRYAGGNCAQANQAGWWFNYCSLSGLTSPYVENVFIWTVMSGWETSGTLRAARIMMKSK